MVTARKPTTATHADRLIALYRAEQQHWDAREMICTFFECPNTEVPATFFTRMNSPDCDSSEIIAAAEAAIRKMVSRRHGAEIEAFLEGLARARAEAPAKAAAEAARARVRAGVARLARRPDAEALLEIVADEIDRLIAERAAA